MHMLLYLCVAARSASRALLQGAALTLIYHQAFELHDEAYGVVHQDWAQLRLHGLCRHQDRTTAAAQR